MTDESDFPLQIDEDKNRNSIYCQFCDSLLLKPKTALYMEYEVKKKKLRKRPRTNFLSYCVSKVAYFSSTSKFFNEQLLIFCRYSSVYH